MDAKSSEKRPDGKPERRKSSRPRRRLVDLTLKAGTDRRKTKEDRRKTDLDLTTERRSDGATERLGEGAKGRGDTGK